MPASYRASQCEIIVGTSGSRLDLIDTLDTSLTLTGAVETDRRRTIAAGGTVGVTADGVSCGLTAAGVFRYTAESKKLLELIDVVFVLNRRDANYAYAFPAVVTAVPITSAAGAIVSINATFQQSAEGPALQAAPRTQAGQVAIASGNQAWHIESGKVTLKTAAFSLAANQFAVVGQPITAEGG